MSTLIGRWRRLWQQPFVRLLREKYRKFRFGFPPSPFSLAFLFTPRKVLEISLKKRKEKKERFTGYRTTCQRKKWKISLESKKKNWKKIVERGGQIRSREPLHEILMESLIQSSPNSFGQYLPTPGNQPLFSTPGDRVPSPLI